MDKNLLDLTFKSKSYRSILDKKVKNNDEQFGNRFVKKTEEDSKFGK